MFFSSKHKKLLNLEGTEGGKGTKDVEKKNVSVYIFSTFRQPLDHPQRSAASPRRPRPAHVCPEKIQNMPGPDFHCASALQQCIIWSNFHHHQCNKSITLARYVSLIFQSFCGDIYSNTTLLRNWRQQAMRPLTDGRLWTFTLLWSLKLRGDRAHKKRHLIGVVWIREQYGTLDAHGSQS